MISNKRLFYFIFILCKFTMDILTKIHSFLNLSLISMCFNSHITFWCISYYIDNFIIHERYWDAKAISYDKKMLLTMPDIRNVNRAKDYLYLIWKEISYKKKDFQVKWKEFSIQYEAKKIILLKIIVCCIFISIHKYKWNELKFLFIIFYTCYLYKSLKTRYSEKKYISFLCWVQNYFLFHIFIKI